MNYPIKYAVQPVFIQLNKGSISRNIPYGYIVSKSFIVEETKCYNESGCFTKYKVVYPVKLYNSFLAERGKISIDHPDFNQYGHCSNAHDTNYVFDRYEDAEKVCNEENGKLILNFYPNESLELRKCLLKEYELAVLRATTALELEEVSAKSK